MKNIWQKVPVWIKAVLLTILLFYPIAFLNQIILLLNLKFLPQFGIGLFIVMGTLYLYWRLAQRWHPFTDEGDIRMRFRFDISNSSNIASIIGLILFTISTISLSFILFRVKAESSVQLEFIQTFFAAPPATAVMLLLALSMSAGVVEEITYRAYVQNTTQRKYPRIISYLIVGVLFAWLHFLPWALFIPYALVSIVFSAVADQQKSVGLVIVAHTLTDVVALLLQYFKLSFISLEMGLPGIGMVFLMFLISIALIFGWKPRQKFAFS